MDGDITPRKSSDCLIEDAESRPVTLIEYSPKPRVGRGRTSREIGILMLHGIAWLLALSVIVYQQCVTLARSPADTSNLKTPTLIPQVTQLRPVRYLSAADSIYIADVVAGMAEADASWWQLQPSLGNVALSDVDALRLGVTISPERLSTEPEKGVYTLESYHSMHCLIIIRQTMLQLAQGEELSIPFGHSMHCLTRILQHIVCMADDTMRPSVEKNVTGHRMCRNWDALRDWAKGNSACYVDSILGTSEEDLTRTNCPTDDGLVLDKL